MTTNHDKFVWTFYRKIPKRSETVRLWGSIKPRTQEIWIPNQRIEWIDRQSFIQKIKYIEKLIKKYLEIWTKLNYIYWLVVHRSTHHWGHNFYCTTSHKAHWWIELIDSTQHCTASRLFAIEPVLSTESDDKNHTVQPQFKSVRTNHFNSGFPSTANNKMIEDTRFSHNRATKFSARLNIIRYLSYCPLDAAASAKQEWTKLVEFGCYFGRYFINVIFFRN